MASSSCNKICLWKETGEWSTKPSAESAAVAEADGQFEKVWRMTSIDKSRSFCVEFASFEVTQQSQAFTILLPIPVSIMRLKFDFLPENVGDSLYMDAARGSVVGVVKEDASAGSSSLVASETAYDAYFTGSDLVAFPPDTARVDQESFSRHTVTGVGQGVVRFWPPLKEDIPAGHSLGFAVPIMKNVAVTSAGEFAVDLRGRFLPQSCALTLVYTVKGGDMPKKCSLIVEYTTT